jgi:hypothetical protein
MARAYILSCGGAMTLNHIILLLTLGALTVGCTNDLKFSKGSNGGLETNPPGVCPQSAPVFVAPPSLVELGQSIRLDYPQGEVSWLIRKPSGQTDTLEGNSTSYTVSELGRYVGKAEITYCGTVSVFDFIFDSFLPVGASSLIINSGDPYTSLVEVSLSLVSSGATEMYITEDATCSTGGSWEAYNTQKLHVLNARNQTANVYAKFRNPVGNSSGCVSDSIIHDDIKPVVQITSGPSSLTNVANASFQMNATDSGSGIDLYFCSLDSGSVRVCSSTVNYTNLADGSHSFSVRVSDNAGNLSDWVQYAWTIDTVRPTLRFTRTPANPSSLALAGFEFTGSDLGSGVDSYECRLDTAAYSACVSPSSVTVTDGSHTYFVRNKDRAGNVSDPISYTWVTDATAPVIVITSAPANPTTERDAAFTFTASDAGLGIASVQCSLDGSVLADCVSPLSYSALDIGSHTFRVVANDRLGNSSQAVHTWSIQRRVIEQPEVIPPGIGSADILFVMDSTGSMYTEHNDYVPFQMRRFLSRLSDGYQIGVITSDQRDTGPYNGGRLVPIEDTFPYQYVMTSETPDVEDVFIDTIARREVTCVYGTWTGPNGRFCGLSGWNLPVSTQLITATQQAIALPDNSALFRDETPLHIVMVSDSNEICSTGMYAGNGLCLPENTIHSGDALLSQINAKWPGKTVKVHSLIWREQDSCAFRGGEVKGTAYERLSQLTGGVSRSLCNPSVNEGNALADAIKGTTSYTITLQCNPIDMNNDGVVNASDVVATFDPQPTTLPSLTLVGNKLKVDPAPAAGTQVNLRYTCP